MALFTGQCANRGSHGIRIATMTIDEYNTVAPVG
jgi:hypothetical protein